MRLGIFCFYIFIFLITCISAEEESNVINLNSTKSCDYRIAEEDEDLAGDYTINYYFDKEQVLIEAFAISRYHLDISAIVNNTWNILKIINDKKDDQFLSGIKIIDSKTKQIYDPIHKDIYIMTENGIIIPEETGSSIIKPLGPSCLAPIFITSHFG